MNQKDLDFIKKVEQMSDVKLGKFLSEYNNKVLSEEKKLTVLRDSTHAELPMMKAGSLNDLNKIAKPFILPSKGVKLPPEMKLSSVVSINLDTDFVVTDMAIAIYEEKEGKVTLVNRDQDPVYGLMMKMIDPQSGRVFSSDYVQVSHYGTPKKPSKMITNHCMKKSTNMEFSFYNSTSRTLYPVIMLKGFRIRVES